MGLLCFAAAENGHCYTTANVTCPALWEMKWIIVMNICQAHNWIPSGGNLFLELDLWICLVLCFIQFDAEWWMAIFGKLIISKLFIEHFNYAWVIACSSTKTKTKTKTKAFVRSCMFWNKPVTNKPIMLVMYYIRAWFGLFVTGII